MYIAPPPLLNLDLHYPVHVYIGWLVQYMGEQSPVTTCHVATQVVGRVHERVNKEKGICNLSPLVLKARQISGSAYCIFKYIHAWAGTGFFLGFGIGSWGDNPCELSYTLDRYRLCSGCSMILVPSTSRWSLTWPSLSRDSLVPVLPVFRTAPSGKEWDNLYIHTCGNSISFTLPLSLVLKH